MHEYMSTGFNILLYRKGYTTSEVRTPVVLLTEIEVIFI
jgi:hypothetical protein